MSYTSPDEVRKVMRNLPKGITDEDILFHIEKADACIDSVLGEVFKTPFNPAPTLIRHISVDLTVFFLAESLYTSQKPNLDEYFTERYKRVMELLEGIGKGDIDIGVPIKIETGYATTNKGDPIFTLVKPRW